MIVAVHSVMGGSDQESRSPVLLRHANKQAVAFDQLARGGGEVGGGGGRPCNDYLLLQRHLWNTVRAPPSMLKMSSPSAARAQHRP